MEFRNANILSAKQFDARSIETLFKAAKELEPIAHKKLTSELLRGKVLASLFYEPSTRTRLSSETAMLRLGGNVITVASQEGSSLVKGETLYDTARMMSLYADVIMLRHKEPGSVEEFSRGVLVPVINAGDGAHEHPTQALTDIFTLEKEKKTIDGLTIAFIGDLKFGRTVHSLAYLLCHFSVKLIFVSPSELSMPQEVKHLLREKGVYFEETENLEDAIRRSDVLYMTRIQRERFESENSYKRFHGVYVLTKGLVERCNPRVTILHPLPRFGEIDHQVDVLEGAAYFRQAQNAIVIRMALFALVLGKI